MNCICQNLTAFTGYFDGENLVIVDGMKETTYYIADPMTMFVVGLIIGIIATILAILLLAIATPSNY